MTQVTWKTGILTFQRIEAGVVAKGPFGAHLRKIHISFEHDFGLRGHFEVAGFARHHLHRLAPQESREHHLVQIGRNRQDAGQAGHRVGADGHGHVDAALRIRGAGAAEMFGAVLLRLPVHARGAFVIHLHAIDAHVALAGLGIAREHQRPGDEAPSILRPALQDRKFQQRETVAADDFLARARLHRLREKRAEFGEFRQHLDLVQQALRRLHIEETANAIGDFLEAFDFERQMNAPLAAQHIDEQRNASSLWAARRAAPGRRRASRAA